MVQSYRSLNSGGDSLASMGILMGKQRVRLTVMDSLACQGNNNPMKENVIKTKKKVQFSESTSVLVSITNARCRPQGARKKDATSAYALRSRISKKIARKPTNDGGVLAVIAKASIKSQAQINKQSIMGKPVTIAQSGSISLSQHLRIEESTTHGPMHGHSGITFEANPSSDDLVDLFRNSLDVGDKLESENISRGRKSTKSDVDKHSEVTSRSQGVGLISLMENLTISSPISNLRRRSSLTAKSITSKLFNVENEENRISSPSTASARKKQDRKKTPKKFSVSPLSHPIRSSPTLISIAPAISESEETDFELVEKTDGVQTANSEPESNDVSREAGDQNGKPSEHFRRSQRPKKSTIFFQLTKVAVSDEDTRAKGLLDKEESLVGVPTSAIDCDERDKAKHQNEKTKSRLTKSSNEDENAQRNPPYLLCTGPKEKVDKRKKSKSIDHTVQVAIFPSGYHNAQHVRRPRRTRKPTSFYTPSSEGHGCAPYKLLSDEVSKEPDQTDNKNDSSRPEHETAHKIKSTSNLRVEKGKQDKMSLTCKADIKTVEAIKNERDLDLLKNDETTGQRSKIEWIPQQLDQLKAAHKHSNPMSRTFWEQVATSVDGKSPGQCRDQWYSLIKTPVVKSKCAQIPSNTAKASEEDDLFDSTPMRNMLDATKMKTSLLNIYAGIKIANIKIPVSNGEELDQNKNFHDHFFQPKIGYKTFLQGMKRDISKEAKNQKKGRKAKYTKSRSKGLHSITSSIKDLEVDMSARLTPGGSFRFQNRNYEDHDEDGWDDQSSCDN